MAVRARARVYELHGDLQFAAAESVIREITSRAGDLDVIVLDIRGIDETAEISVKLLGDLRDQFSAEGGEAVIVDPGHSLLRGGPESSGPQGVDGPASRESAAADGPPAAPGSGTSWT